MSDALKASEQIGRLNQFFGSGRFGKTPPKQNHYELNTSYK